MLYVGTTGASSRPFFRQRTSNLELVGCCRALRWGVRFAFFMIRFAMANHLCSSLQQRVSIIAHF